MRDCQAAELLARLSAAKVRRLLAEAEQASSIASTLCAVLETAGEDINSAHLALLGRQQLDRATAALAEADHLLSLLQPTEGC